MLDSLGQIYGGFSRLEADHVARWATETGRFLDKPEDPQEGQWDEVVRETFLDARALHRIVGSTPNGLRELLEFAELYWSDVVRSYALTAYEGVEWISYCLMMLLRDPIEFGVRGPVEFRPDEDRRFRDVRGWYKAIRDHLQKDIEWEERFLTGNAARTSSGDIILPRPEDVTNLMQQAYAELYRLDERDVMIQKIMKLLPNLGKQELAALYTLLWSIKN